LGPTYLDGSYSEVYPDISQDEDGLRRLFRQFSFPGGIPSHVSPETPGSIHEGGELGYCLSHAYGAAFDNPGLLVACVVGDGEAETGPLATSWHSNKFLNPVRDGAVLPILHLNGHKIAGPTVLARIPREELDQLLRGFGHQPHYVEGHDPMTLHAQMATTLDKVLAEITSIQKAARRDGFHSRPRWPMVVLITPKGWTGPVMVDGLRERDITSALAKVDKEGMCDVKYTVGANGKPKDVQTNCSPPEYNDLMLAAVAKMKFEPGQKGGAPTDWPGMSMPVKLTKPEGS
jgi:xylulose-5-phosphate/fructose-6-phosphate phosphoketolase